MQNNAIFGFSIQKIICDKFNIVPNSQVAINSFKSAYDLKLKSYLLNIVNDVFERIGLVPIECTTFDKINGIDCPYNFILSDNSTLSIRTNINGCKVAPREVGQAGFLKLNYYFKDIYGKNIENQDDIKHLLIEKTDKVLPIFFEHLFDADYILWIFINNNGESDYKLINGNSTVDIDFKLSDFTFTRGFDEWSESTTLKYKDKSIAEIQIHKHRSFKFRFIMKNVLPLISATNMTTETLGITAEKVICDLFDLKYPVNFFKRYSEHLQYLIVEPIRDAFQYMPPAIKHCGSEVGERGGNSKSSYDFLLKGNNTLSLKTNVGKMVCPPEVGQPNAKTCYLYFNKFTDEDHIDKDIFKKMVIEHADKMLPIYLSRMFDCDYLLWIYEDKASAIYSGIPYNYRIFKKNYGNDFVFEKSKITFSKESVENWNESNTLYYDGLSIGEFQVHNNRNCFKFRFNFINLTKLIKK